MSDYKVCWRCKGTGVYKRLGVILVEDAPCWGCSGRGWKDDTVALEQYWRAREMPLKFVEKPRPASTLSAETDLCRDYQCDNWCDGSCGRRRTLDEWMAVKEAFERRLQENDDIPF